MHGTAPGAANVSHREPGLARVGHVQVRARVVSSAAKKVIDISMYLYVCVMSQNVTYMAFFSNEPPSTNQIRSSVHPLGDPPRPIQTPPPIFRISSRIASERCTGRARPNSDGAAWVERSLDAKGRTRRLAESCPSQRRKDKPRVGRDAERRWDVILATRSVPRRAGSSASPPRAGIAASGTGRWVATSAMRASIVRSSSGGETSSSSIGCVPVGAACQPRGLSSRKNPRGASASASAPARSPRCLAARVASFTVGARPIARDASRRPEVSARAAEGFGRVSTVDSPASSDADAETDRDRDPSSPTVAPNGSDTNTRAETDATGAVVAPRARTRYRKRRPSRARRWDGPVDSDESAGTGSGAGAPPPSNSTKSGWAELRRRELGDDASSSSSFASAIGDLAGLGFGGGFGGSNAAPVAAAAAAVAVVLVRFAASRSRDASNSSAIDAVSTRCSSSLKFPRCRRPPTVAVSPSAR